MASDWKYGKLGDLVNFTPKRTIKKNEIAPFVAMADISEGFREISNISEKLYKGGGSRFVNGDILFARITPCLQNGKTAKVRGLSDDKIAHGSTEFIVFGAKYAEFDQDYLYYVARDPKFREFAESRMEGSTGRQRVSWQALSDYEMYIPSKGERKAIGSLLSILDDKIDLNRRMNATLEGMAQALFKSWFVDFDPVLDNALAAGNPIPAALAERAETRRQALANGTANRQTAKSFPATFHHTEELGWIPAGWEVKPIIEYIQLTMGQSPSSDHYNKDGIGLPFHQGVTNYGERFPKHVQYSTGGNRYAEKGDILFSVRAPVGRINISDRRIIIGRGLSALRHKQNYQGFLVYFLKHIFQEEDSIGSGTIFNSVNKKDMQNLPFLAPDDGLAKTFNNIANSYDEKIAGNAVQTEVLSNLRDTLLPKLISGELRIPAAAKLVEEAVA